MTYTKTKQLLGISLALVMVLGSVPLGFSEPINQQLKHGLEISELQCDNDSHVLVQRTNGNLACVTETTALKIGWEIIDNSISLVEYEFPITAKYGNEVSETSMTYGGNVKLILSNLPKLGETAEVELTFINSKGAIIFADDGLAHFSLEDFNSESYLTLSADNLEFIDQRAETSTVDGKIISQIREVIPPLELDESFTITTTVMGVSEGFSRISGHTLMSNQSPNFDIHVSEHETLLRADYHEKYPQPAIMQANGNSVENTCPENEICAVEPVEPNPPTESESADQSTSKVSTEAEYRAFMKNTMKMSDEEIEEMVKKYFPDPDSSTQSFFLPSAFATNHEIQIYGIVMMNELPLAPDSINARQTAINDVYVCAWEWDSVNTSFAPANCDFTDSTGGYVISNVTPSSGDNTIDILMTYETQGAYSYVAGTGNQHNVILDNPYRVQDSIDRNILSSKQIDRQIQTSVGVENENNAFWISDSIADARKKISDEFGFDINNKVFVAWQFDEPTSTFHKTNSNLNGGGAYYCHFTDNGGCQDETMYLDGLYVAPTNNTPLPDRYDDSNSRYVIIHEYGHHFMNIAYGGQPPDVCNPNNADPNHPFFDRGLSYHEFNAISSEGCAWREGFSDILPSLVDDSNVYPKSIENISVNNVDTPLLIEYNYETGIARFENDNGGFMGSSNPLPTADGQEIEGHVATAIWDIYDAVNGSETANNGEDDLFLEYDEIGWTYRQLPNNFEDFYNSWQGKTAPAYPDSTNIMELHYMDFVATPTAHTPPSPFTAIGGANPEPTEITLTGEDSLGNEVDFYLASLPSKGTLSHTSLVTPFETFATSSTIDYTSNPDETGDDSFTFYVRTGNQQSSPVTVNITITDDENPELITIDYAQRTELDEILVKLTEQPTIQLGFSNFDLSQGTLTNVSHTQIEPQRYSAFVYLTFTGLENNPNVTPTVSLINTNLGNPEIGDDQKQVTLIDSDSDGFPNYADSCPNEPENFNGFEDTDGCPDTPPVQNQKPRADAGSSQQVFAGDLVTLNATNTYDPNNDLFTQFWSQTDSQYQVTLSDNSLTPTFTAPPVTTYTELIFEITVTEQTNDALVDTDSVSVYVSPISQSRAPDSEFVNPNPDNHNYEQFGEFMETNGKSVLASMDPNWIANYPGINSNSFTKQKIDVTFEDNSVEFSDGRIFEIIDIVYDNSIDLTVIAESDVNNDELILLIDAENNKVSLIDSVTLQTVAFTEIAGTAYLFEYDNLNDYASLQGGVRWSDGVEFGESIALLDSDTVAIGDEDFTYSDPRTFQSGLVHVYDNIPIPTEQTDATLLIENPELIASDHFGMVITNVGKDKVAISGSLSNIYLYHQDGTLIQSYPNPLGGDFTADFMESFGIDRFIVSDNNSLYIFNSTSAIPEKTITLNGVPNAISTNIDKDWILVGTSSMVYLYNELGEVLQEIPIPSSASDVTFVKNKIVVGSANASPNNILNSGAVYLYSPVDGTLLESIENDIVGEEFGYQVGQLDSGRFIAVSVHNYDDGGQYSEIGKIEFYSNLNISPLANANANVTEAFVGDMIQLDGISSSDLDGDDLTYSWTQVTNNQYQITFDDSTSISPTFQMPDAPTDTVFEISLTVNDGIADNTDAITITVKEISDIDPPTFTLVPSDITAEATAIQTPVNIGNATATDNVDPNPVISNNSTGTFPLGETIVQWTATDSSNNNSTALQIITLQDTTAPILSVPSDYAINSELNQLPIPLDESDYGTATAYDNFIVTITNNAPDSFQLGTTEIKYTATDENGNESTATQKITVFNIDNNFTLSSESDAILVTYNVTAPINNDVQQSLKRIQFSVTLDENDVKFHKSLNKIKYDGDIQDSGIFKITKDSYGNQLTSLTGEYFVTMKVLSTNSAPITLETQSIMINNDINNSFILSSLEDNTLTINYNATAQPSKSLAKVSFLVEGTDITNFVDITEYSEDIWNDSNTIKLTRDNLFNLLSGEIHVTMKVYSTKSSIPITLETQSIMINNVVVDNSFILSSSNGTITINYNATAQPDTYLKLVKFVVSPISSGDGYATPYKIPYDGDLKSDSNTVIIAHDKYGNLLENRSYHVQMKVDSVGISKTVNAGKQTIKVLN